MEIVVISASFVPSTAANSIEVMKVAHALAEIGHDVTLIVPGEQTKKWNELAIWYGLTKPFPIIWLKENLAFRRYDFAFKAVNIARKMKADLVYTWMLQAAVLSLWRKIPVMLELHDRITGNLAPTLFKLILHSKTPKHLLLITMALKRVIENELQVSLPVNIFQVAPNGIELERYASLPGPEAARKVLGLAEGLSVGYSGHFYNGRGMDILLSLAKSFPEINFLWIGGTPEAVNHWKERISLEGVINVTLTGFVPNKQIALYQAACDILLMPYELAVSGSSGGNSADICSPMKMFEYLAAGRAIISSDLPVLHEVLSDQNAIFCPAEDPVAWQSALQALIKDPEKIAELGKQAQLDAQAYSWKRRAEHAISALVK
jgi:glycosyltransferase involved in cell wall biosynthesis